jgi:hypothetical protein
MDGMNGSWDIGGKHRKKIVRGWQTDSWKKHKTNSCVCENEKWKTTEQVGNVLYLIRVDIVPENLLPALKQVEQNRDHVPEALQKLELGAAQRNVAEGRNVELKQHLHLLERLGAFVDFVQQHIVAEQRLVAAVGGRGSRRDIRRKENGGNKGEKSRRVSTPRKISCCQET